jgi:hypothetical protein
LSRSKRTIAFVLVVVVSLAAAVAYVALAAAGGDSAGAGVTPGGGGGPSKVTVASGDTLVVDLDRTDPAHYGRVAVVRTADPTGSRTVAPLACERVYFASGRGLCLTKSSDAGTAYQAEVFDDHFRVLHTLPVAGIPSRTRVSADGRYGATTTFVSGHSYGAPGKFSTQTLLIDLSSGKTIADLEQFTVGMNGSTIDRPDFNFWGVTFDHTDSNRFYATLATAGKTYLVRGDISGRSVEVLHENVECPSLSPDGTRIGYKKLVSLAAGSPPVWQLYVLDLKTMTETRLAETAVVDDQVEWLDNDHLIYGVDENLHVVSADGTGSAATFIAGASSPAVVG